MTLRTPSNPQAEHVIAFVKLIGRERPFFVPIQPAQSAEVSECFDNVPRVVAQQGGRMVCGWAVFEWPGVMLEAMAHAIWQPPPRKGRSIDVTPTAEDAEETFFLPDPRVRA